MAKIKITKRTVEALKVAAKDYIAFDTELPGFGVRVMPSGKRFFLIQYRGSQFTATPAAPPDTAGDCSKDRAAAPSTLDEQADRGRGRRLASHRQPRFAQAGPEQAERSGAGARPPL